MGGFKEECATYKIALFLYKRKWYNYIKMILGSKACL